MKNTTKNIDRKIIFVIFPVIIMFVVLSVLGSVYACSRSFDPATGYITVCALPYTPEPSSYYNHNVNTNTAPVVKKGTLFTRAATSKSAVGGQLNGSYVNGNQGEQYCQAFFEFGTNYSNFQRTPVQNIYLTNTVTNFYQYLGGLNNNTNYLYRAVVMCPSGTEFGEVLSLKTGTQTAAKNTTKTVAQKTVSKSAVTKGLVTNSGTAAKSKAEADCNCTNDLISLNIQNIDGQIVAGGITNWRVSFKNIGDKTLLDSTIKLVLPTGLTVEAASFEGVPAGSKNVSINLPTFEKGEEGEFFVATKIASSTEEKFSLNAYSSYTIPATTKNKVASKGQSSTYTLATVNTSVKNVSSQNTVQQQEAATTSTPFQAPKTMLEWMITVLVFTTFFAALRYLYLALKKI